jgi:hypothetical protein
MGARGARRGRRQRQHTQTGTRDALVQYYDWAGCAVRQTCLRMGARGARRGRRRSHTHTGTQGALVQYYDWAGCAVRLTCLRMGARGARRGRRRSHTQTGTQGALVQYYDWAGCAVRRTCLRMGARGARKGGALTHKQASLWGWTVDNFQLSETLLRGRGGEPEGRATAQVACEPTAGVSVRGELVCVRARTTAAGLSCLHRAHPHLPGDPCAHQPGPQFILLTRIAVPVQWRC